MTPTATRPSPSARLAALLRPAGFALAAVLLLAACSKHADPAAAGNAAAPRYAAVARGRVDIEGGLLALAMPREGVLASVAAREGETVKQDQLLAALDTRPAQLAVDAAKAQLEQAQSQLKLLDIKQAAAKQRAQRLAAAAAAGAGDGQSADDANEASNQLGAERDASQAAVDMAAQKLAEAKYELAQRSLRAPFDAVVVRVLAQPGASVSPASGPLFTLLPNKPRIVRAELNESFVGAVHPGMRAEVVANDDAENARWTARVLRVGQVYGPATLENDPQIRANARTVECVLAFDQPEQQLRIGQRVIVRFLPDGKE
ncbi:HlyD family efflux transporter periplasmic adaptor subunit [Rhodanobacter sp. PCA2]|uniref:efflux RND transporter periplasmic adaptor subunit n=1 Tax=Rhodanobacter sp. PCA2 TaxID=2006117 RepID=UPI0015E648F9|nr:HlyD family efflux transporter periplasmic adaptor subunit [Rhodanobacter sp. PCA2]MBA2079202.1 secretion protein HlyD [Rhodanobacter sp. PCA2]